MMKNLHKEDFEIGRNRTRRLMKRLNLKVRQKRKYKVTTDSKHNLRVAKNVLNYESSPSASNQAWGTDITYRAPSPARRPRAQRVAAHARHRLRRTAPAQGPRARNPSPYPASVQHQRTGEALPGQLSMGGAAGAHLWLFSACESSVRTKKGSGKPTMRSGSPMNQPCSNSTGSGASAGLPRGEPCLTQFETVSICSLVSVRSFENMP